MQLDEIKDAYRSLELSLSTEDMGFKTKVQMLEQSQEQMAVRYQGLVSERSQLKVALQVAERKLEKKQQRLQQYDKALTSAKSKNEQMERILKELRQEFVKMQNKDGNDGIIRNAPAGQRVAIKGGGGKRAAPVQFEKPQKKIQGGLKTIPE